ncbi:MAG: hypothetical protein ACE5K3_09605 [bacterium]
MKWTKIRQDIFWIGWIFRKKGGGVSKKITGAVLIFVFLIGVGSTSGFVTHKDPHGFSLDYPEGWGVRVIGGGCIVVGKDVENMMGPMVWIWTVTLRQSGTTKDVVDSMVTFLKKSYPDLKILSMRELSTVQATVALKFSYSDQGAKYQGLLLGSREGKRVILSGFVSPWETYAQSKASLVRILSSFKVDPTLRDASKIAPPDHEFVTYKDPYEGAFTLKVPRGWKVEGGVVRPYIDAAVALEIKKDPEGTVAISYYAPLPPLFAEPSEVLSMAGFLEGSRYNPSYGAAQDMIVYHYLPGQSYIREWLLPQIKQNYPDTKIVSSRDRPDLLKGAPQIPWLEVSRACAEAAVEGTVSGTKVKGKITVFTQLTRPPGMPSGMWQANVLIYNAPPQELEQLEAIANKMNDTFRVDPAWALREAQEQIKRSRIISHSADEVARIIRQTYENRSATLDEISRKWSNAILGRVDLVDPETGEIDWGVPSGSNYYWKQGDVIIGTEIYQRPTIDSRLLTDLDELIKD